MDGCVYRSQFDLCEKNKEEDEKLGIRRWCDFEGCEDKHPSNADCIRQMSDKELAELISSDFCEIICSPETNCQYADCRGKILNWLRQEAEHGCAD